jgi:hypothetical protein
MTEAELWELILMSQSNMATFLALYFSVVSGYLIVSYLIGDKLTTLQSTLISGLFVIFGILCTLGTVAFLGRAAFLLQFTDETYRSPLSVVIPYTPFITAAILLIGVVACLKFMWDVRQPKTE